MSRLFLVRHGQANLCGPNYDELSPLGETQARLLGMYWARWGRDFDRVATGPRVRQAGTARIVGQALRAAGRAFPGPVAIPEFDEFAGEQVLERTLPALLRHDEGIARLQQAHENASGPDGRRKAYQRLFEAVIGKWVDGEQAPAGVESWTAFCDRVNRGLSQVLDGATRGQNVAVFTSGGPIGVAMQRALHLSAQDTLRVTWMSANSSYTEFLFSGARFTLSAFNVHPHLEEASLVTHR